MDDHRLTLLNQSRPKNLWEANVEVAEKVKEMVKKNVHEETNLPFISSKITRHTIRLPARSTLPRGYDPQWLDMLCDRHVQMELEQAMVVNWCRSIKTLQPLTVPGDGNCLLHAVSIAMWGVPDSALILRRLLYIALVEDTDSAQIQYRWKAEKGWLNSQVPSGGLSMNTGEWNSEWSFVKRTAEDLHNPAQPNLLAFESLEEIHIFVLANILRRPIIVLAEPVIRSVYGTTVAPNNCGGIYLPLLLPPDDCVKTPIVLGFESNHLVPFIGTEDYLNQHVMAKDVVPLVNHNLEPLHIHFLSGAQEEQQAATLLMNYLNLIEVSCTTLDSTQLILSASLQYLPINPALDLMKEYCRVQPASTTSTPAPVAASLVQTLCTTPGCKFYGAPECGGRCSQCLREYTLQDAHPSVGSSHHLEASAPHRLTVEEHAASPHHRELCKTVACSLEGKAEYNGYCRTCFMNCPSAVGTPRYQTPQQSPLESLTSFTRALGAIKVCIGPNCGGLACDSCNGLCRYCFKALESRNRYTAQQPSEARRYSPSMIEDVQQNPSTIEAMRRPNAAEAQRESPCRHHTYIRVGDQPGSPAVQRTTRPKYTEPSPPPAVRRPVGPPRASAKQCCTINCDYYGDPNLDGYCSHCYPPYLTPASTTTLHHSNNAEAPFGFMPR